MYRNNQVSLEIIKALIEACHRDLNLFSKYVVKIIDLMLETKDIEIIDLACQVVKCFIYIYVYIHQLTFFYVLVCRIYQSS